MARIGPFVALILLASPAGGECLLCAPGKARVENGPARPLNIEIAAVLDLGRAAQGRGGGSITIDERTGGRRVTGLVDLGGMSLKGEAALSGEPFRHVRVGLPPSIRLTAPDGSVAEVMDLRTDLPPDPALDAGGRLSFAFGGRLVVTGAAAGDFRGRIPITADYQ